MNEIDPDPSLRVRILSDTIDRGTMDAIRSARSKRDSGISVIHGAIARLELNLDNSGVCE